MDSKNVRWRQRKGSKSAGRSMSHLRLAMTRHPADSKPARESCLYWPYLCPYPYHLYSFPFHQAVGNPLTLHRTNWPFQAGLMGYHTYRSWHGNCFGNGPCDCNESIWNSSLSRSSLQLSSLGCLKSIVYPCLSPFLYLCPSHLSWSCSRTYSACNVMRCCH